MDEAAKRRLVGAAVLIALAVIFVPMLVEEERDERFGDPIVIPDPPVFGPDAGAPDAAGSASEGSLPSPDSIPLPLPVPEPPGDSNDEDALPLPAAPASADAPVREPRESASQPPPSRPASRPVAAAAPDGPKPVPSGVRAWVVQVASVSSQSGARNLRDELRRKGYPAFVSEADVSGRTYYRVQVGPEVERERADRLAEQLAGETSNPPLVKRYP